LGVSCGRTMAIVNYRSGSPSPVRRAAGEGPLFARRTAGVDVRPAALCNLHDVINLTGFDPKRKSRFVIQRKLPRHT
jgi:hypothetical protein